MSIGCGRQFGGGCQAAIQIPNRPDIAKIIVEPVPTPLLRIFIGGCTLVVTRAISATTNLRFLCVIPVTTLLNNPLAMASSQMNGEMRVK